MYELWKHERVQLNRAEGFNKPAERRAFDVLRETFSSFGRS
jgi:hypothetical protein